MHMCHARVRLGQYITNARSTSDSGKNLPHNPRKEWWRASMCLLWSYHWQDSDHQYARTTAYGSRADKRSVSTVSTVLGAAPRSPLVPGGPSCFPWSLSDSWYWKGRIPNPSSHLVKELVSHTRSVVKGVGGRTARNYPSMLVHMIVSRQITRQIFEKQKLLSSFSLLLQCTVVTVRWIYLRCRWPLVCLGACTSYTYSGMGTALKREGTYTISRATVTLLV
ncbi:hypothetical protein EDB83DRAFT_1175637 [Lactarius deliciosus]|nr:hypothetical protein EDB83DRAFT_1175637 [Lactarius deliciosus]